VTPPEDDIVREKRMLRAFLSLLKRLTFVEPFGGQVGVPRRLSYRIHLWLKTYQFSIENPKFKIIPPTTRLPIRSSRVVFSMVDRRKKFSPAGSSKRNDESLAGW